MMPEDVSHPVSYVLQIVLSTKLERPSEWRKRCAILRRIGLNQRFNNFVLTARVFFSGAWCRVAVFDGNGSVGHLQLLRSGRISVKNRGAVSIYIDQPSVLFYPRPCPHALLPEEETEIDLVCASLDFGDRVGSPLSLALPEMVILPLDSIKTLAPLL